MARQSINFAGQERPKYFYSIGSCALKDLTFYWIEDNEASQDMHIYAYIITHIHVGPFI
jgi:hypothetical protein